MAKNTSSSLHDLIKGLSKSEKRYFKIYSSRHTIGEQNKYVQLFDFIDQSENYDEEAIFQQFEGEAFLNSFSLTKNRLYESIIKALHAFHIQSSATAQIYRMLHGAEILMDKNLLDQAWKQLLSAERLAKKHEKWQLIPEINNLKKRVLEWSGEDLVSNEKYTNVYVDEKEVNDIIIQNTELWHAKNSLFILFSKFGRARTSDMIIHYQNCLSAICMDESSYSHSSSNSLMFHQLMSLYYFAILDNKNVYSHAVKVVESISNNTKMDKEKEQNVLMAYTVLLAIAIENNDIASSKNYMQKIESYKKIYLSNDLDDNASSASIFLLALSSFNFLIHEGSFEKASLFIAQLSDFANKENNHLTKLQKSWMNFYFAKISFGLGNYSKCLHYLQEIINETELDEFVDLLSAVQLLRIAVLIELERYELLGYIIKGTQRFLKKQNRDFLLEKTILKFSLKVAQSNNLIEQEEYFYELFEAIKASRWDKFDRVLLSYFDFVSWAESKSKRTTFYAIKKRNAWKNMVA